MMCVNHFSRLEPGQYRDSATGVLLQKEDGEGWVLIIENHKHFAFVSLQWGEPLATYRISGFSTMAEAKSFDFFSMIHRTGAPYVNKRGVCSSVPVRGLGSIPVIPCFTTRDLAFKQGTLF